MMADNAVLRIHHIDVTALRASLCVSTIHNSKNLRTGQLSSCVLKNAGLDVQEEIYRKSKEGLRRCHTICTKPGKLTSFKRLMFVCLSHWDTDDVQKPKQDDIQHVVLATLKYAHGENMDSVAFPALGMGGLGYPPYEVSMGMLSGIGRFYEEFPSSKVTTIHIALYGPDKDSMVMFIQSAMKFIDMFHKNTRMFAVIMSNTLRSLEQIPFVKVKSAWEKFRALFIRRSPLPSGQLFKMEVTPELHMTQSLNAFRNAYNEVKLIYLTNG